jgi:hypothetical protein
MNLRLKVTGTGKIKGFYMQDSVKALEQGDKVGL